jgi:F-type H+-transporting ATPase subunit gamma
MSGKLIKLKSKIKATTKTKKITKALELIAASKLKNFQDKALMSQKFEEELIRVAQLNYDLDFENIYTELREEGKTLFVLYTSDKGFCGPLNSKLISTLTKSDLWKNTPIENRLLITIGKKGYDFARNNKISVVKSFQEIEENISIPNLASIIDEVVSLWDQNLIKDLHMVTPYFKNTFAYYPKIEKFLPLNFKDNDETHPNTIFESNSQEFLQGIFLKIIFAKFFRSFMELKATEYSSRMLAMQNSTNSASEIIKSLTLKYNKSRQESITNEIAEILGNKFNE